jgi:hypothetical protein
MKKLIDRGEGNHNGTAIKKCSSHLILLHFNEMKGEHVFLRSLSSYGIHGQNVGNKIERKKKKQKKQIRMIIAMMAESNARSERSEGGNDSEAKVHDSDAVNENIFWVNCQKSNL